MCSILLVYKKIIFFYTLIGKVAGYWELVVGDWTVDLLVMTESRNELAVGFWILTFGNAGMQGSPITLY